jgi:hypothetical protein
MTVAADKIPTFADAEAEFEQAWANPKNTTFEIPGVDVNRVLAERYTMEPSRPLTRSMVWDMELKKAWDPKTYIPYVVSSGRSWGRHEVPANGERFFRTSVQIGWITERRGDVNEEVFIDRDRRRILFMGRQEMTTDTGETVIASDHQPLFHVEHAAGGSEETPLNVWRIVILTDKRDPRFTEPFKAMVKAGLLPGFLEIYIERDLGIALARR